MRLVRLGLVIALAVVLAGSGQAASAPPAASLQTGAVAPTPPTSPTPTPGAHATQAAVEFAGVPAPIEPTTGQVPAAVAPTFRQLIGQKLVVRMEGTTPSADLLGRIGRGEVGGIILFRSNITSRSALVALTRRLQEAAADGRQPPLLIAVDQEGGSVKRIPWAPPTLSAAQMGHDGRAAVARSQGASTGAALGALGINVDLAPVADVPGSTASFMYRAGRTFSLSAARTALLSDAFAAGLASKGVLATMKHFPGIGLAIRNTDASVVTIWASRAALDAGLRPYRTAIAHGIPLVMLSNATYAAYDRANAAGWSLAIAETLLRRDLGFGGVTITDSLDGTGHARGLATWLLAVRAATAGTDMILTTSSEATSRGVYAKLLSRAKAGSIPRATLQASYDRIVALKAGL